MGAIAVESRLWLSYRNEPRTPELLTTAGGFARLRTNVLNFLAGMSRLRPERTGPLPEVDLPLQFVVSGRALEGGRRTEPYRAILDLAATGTATLVAHEGAGPLDFQDYPHTQPLLSFLFGGMRGAPRSPDPIADTVAAIGTFAEYLVEQRRTEEPPEDEDWEPIEDEDGV